MRGIERPYRFFNRLSIRHKLVVIIMGITAFALFSSLTIVTTMNYYILIRDAEKHAVMLGNFSARNVSASLVFPDHQMAKDSLSVLSLDKSVEGACVYDKGGLFFASYGARNCPDNAPDVTKTFDKVSVQTPIMMGTAELGTLYLFYSLAEAHVQFFMNAMIGFVVAIMALTMAYIITNAVQSIISRPVTELASAAYKFVLYQDFSIRAKKTSEDELGKMVEAFNNMVRGMEERDRMIIRAKEAAEKASEEAKKASQMKSDFLAHMSHELRTPLNSIIGLSKIMLEDAALDPEELEMTGTVFRSASTLLDIVNDILDLSKIESGQIVLERIGFDFRSVVASVAETLAPIASKKGVSLNYNIKEDLPFVLGDPVRISRILTNLVGNAVKYTDTGEVTIIIDHTPSPGKAQIMCSVVDTGIGIPEEKLEIIFQRFSQADDSTTRKFGGTGLGLTITKELVEMMGGEIGVSSTVGRGSTFWFKIPFDITDSIHDELKEKRTEMAIGGNASRIPAAKAKILIAEDYEMNQVFIKKLLSRLGLVKFDLVENGLDAINAFKKNSYDLILMDCHMPEMDGYSATKRIRTLEVGTGNRIPIIALTADAMAGTRDKCIKTGMDDYISKPIDSTDFRNLLSRWFIFTQSSKSEKKSDDVDEIIDLSALREYADTKTEMRSFCDLFFSKTEEELENLGAECTEGDNECWTEIAHKIKGSAGMIGAFRLQKLCAQAQDMRIASLAERKAKLNDLRASYGEVKNSLKSKLG